MKAKEFLKGKDWKESDKGMFDFNGLADLLTEYAKDLQHHYDTTVGLYATDRPELVEDPKGVMFQIK